MSRRQNSPLEKIISPHVYSDSAMIRCAAAVIEAGWRPPVRIVETVEELDALPDDAAIRDRNGKLWGAKSDGVPSEALRSLLPVTVLYEGGAS
ncbi:hypothetical protein [Rhodococcus sp. Leaf233]|uniref:hypothetical protein n=1 Tax=Rhodococcus sp. Leaf233 TaxID=1736302 RepID=UPI00070C719D|nr:hypothetical protein [Rhodococcus sp. Leaf233]KQU33529.1 hypothetical protein ASH04_06745 [Rhodococcus sp. Leaf233]